MSQTIPDNCLDRRTLRRMAGGYSFERGRACLAEGQVRALTEHGGTVTAEVQGVGEYRVKMWVRDGEVAFSCTCPVGAEGVFCEHCVAVGLEWLEEGIPGEQAPRRTTKPTVTMDDVRAYLTEQDKAVLVDRLMEKVAGDKQQRQRLLIQVARERSKELDLAEYLHAIDRALRRDGLADYGAAGDCRGDFWRVIDLLEGLLREGLGSEVVELAEHVLAAIEDAVKRCNGPRRFLRCILKKIEKIHHAACEKARPDPEYLAKTLLEWEIRTEWVTFSNAATRYGDVLGEKGLALYQKLAEAEWRRMPALGPGGDASDRSRRRIRLTRIMERLARRSGDPEALMEIKESDLSSASRHLEIARLYKKAGRDDLALEWAERGLAAFPEGTDGRLREFLAEEYHHRKRHDEAMALLWAQFTDSPGLSQFQKLKSHADRIGQWTAWRERALVFLKGTLAGAKSEAAENHGSSSAGADHSELVRILLWENHGESAWHEARQGGCSKDLWIQIAGRLEGEHPEDALDIYRRQIERVLACKSNEAYREAVGLLYKINRLMDRLGQRKEFSRYLRSIRTTYQRRWNFMELLDQERW